MSTIGIIGAGYIGGAIGLRLGAKASPRRREAAAHVGIGVGF